jgi:hypothetical protein
MYRVPLRQFEPSHAEETLGVSLSMDGNNKAKIEIYLEKVKNLPNAFAPTS